MTKKAAVKKAAKRVERGAKSAWIKDYLAKHPDAKMKEVSEASEKAGMGRVQHVQFVGNGGKSNSKLKRTLKKGVKAALSNSEVGGVAARKAAIRLIAETGSIAEAKRIFAEICEVAEAVTKTPF